MYTKGQDTHNESPKKSVNITQKSCYFSVNCLSLGELACCLPSDKGEEKSPIEG